MRRGGRSLHPTSTRICIVMLAVALAYAASRYERDLNVPRPAVLGVRPAPRSQGGGPASRVVWILVDGLRLDASRAMPALDRLRAEGLEVVGRAEFPTLTGPNFVAQASGIEPAASGVVSNAYPGEVALDSVFRRAKLAGLRTGLLTTDPDDGLHGMYETWLDEVRLEDPELHLPAAQLVFAHIGWVDVAGHASGAASPAYRAAVARADAAIAHVARTLDPAHDALVVTSDHGHLDAGGHGGTERPVTRIPIVVWGAGTTHAVRTGRGRDVGPTIASLLGLGALSNATGRPLLHPTAMAARQRLAAATAVRAAGLAQVDHVPLAVFVAAVVLILLGANARLDAHRVRTAPVYGSVFAALLFATHTTSLSISNDSLAFGVRLTTCGVLAVLAQLLLGGRHSLLPATLAASLAVLATALGAAHQPLTPVDATLRFLPIPAIGGLAFACLATAAIGADAGTDAALEAASVPDRTGRLSRSDLEMAATSRAKSPG
jgi:type I phosphodiesterase/nucleotide pyrophosphatase